MDFEKYVDLFPIPFTFLVALLCPKEIENNDDGILIMRTARKIFRKILKIATKRNRQMKCLWHNDVRELGGFENRFIDFFVIILEFYSIT